MRKFLIFALLFLPACAGFNRNCASMSAGIIGADWMVAQYNAYGDPTHCWKLVNVSISNESQSDGIYWIDSNSGDLVHISGWYNRVQLSIHSYDIAEKVDGKWKAAAEHLGVDSQKCKNGKYRDKE